MEATLPPIAQETIISGEKALAWGTFLADINFMAAVAAIPGYELVSYLCEIGKFRGDNLAWYSNGKSAVEAAFGATLAGKKAAVSLRSCEFVQTLDTLTAMSLTDWSGGLLVFCADDPGSWFTHNELDSRALCAAVRIPVLEACDINTAFSLPTQALHWSLKYKLPVVIRYTTSFSHATEIETNEQVKHATVKTQAYHWQKPLILLPKDVLERRVLSEHRLTKLAKEYGHSNRNKIVGKGNHGILCAGYLAKKVRDLVDFEFMPFKMLALATLHPLPETTIKHFVNGLERLLVLEEGEPLLEKEVLIYAQTNGIQLEVNGKLDHTVPRAGELFRWQLEEILLHWYPDFTGSATFFPFQEQKDQFLVDGFCQGCSYQPVFDLLGTLLHSASSPPIVVANPGCVLRALIRQQGQIQISLTPGSSIAIAAAISRQKSHSLVIALIGDNAFYHSGINSLIDAIYHRSELLVIIFDNSISAQSGFQPNPGSGINAKNQKTQAIPIEGLLTGLPAHTLTVTTDEPQQLHQAFTEAVTTEGVRVLQIKKKCVIS